MSWNCGACPVWTRSSHLLMQRMRSLQTRWSFRRVCRRLKGLGSKIVGMGMLDEMPWASRILGLRHPTEGRMDDSVEASEDHEEASASSIGVPISASINGRREGVEKSFCLIKDCLLLNRPNLEMTLRQVNWRKAKFFSGLVEATLE